MSVKSELTKLNVDEYPSITKQDLDENLKEKNFVESNSAASSQDKTKSKYGITVCKSSCYAKNMKLPYSKRKCVPVSSLTDTSAKVVLSERNVEIKDLESKVKFLKSKIKELEDENKTLQNVQSRQEKELKKFKEGLTDIPALLRSHKEEIKVYESTITSLRKELRDCQKELKLRNESLLKKQNQITKLSLHLRQNEKFTYEHSSEIKQLKASKTDLEGKNNNLIRENESLKTENEGLYKQIKNLNLKIQNLEENLSKENNLNKILKNELNELKEKYENMFVQIPNEEKTQNCKIKIHHVTADDASIEVLNKSSFEDCLENQTKKLTDSVFNDNQTKKLTDSVFNDIDERNACCVKSVDKTKDTLIDNFKNCQNFCCSQLRSCDTALFDSGLSNIKLLPPLKTASKSTSRITNFGKRDSPSSSTDVNFIDDIKSSHCDILTRDFQRKIIAANCEKNKFDTINKNKSNVSALSLNEDDEDLQNYSFIKDIHCTGKSEISELKKPWNSSHIAKRKESVHDMKNSDISYRNLEDKKCSYFGEISVNDSKYRENSMSDTVFECITDIDKDKAVNSKYRSTFLKQNINTKPETCHFDKISEQKSPGSQFVLSWWDKW